MKKVAFCVPSTTNKREWSFVQDTYLWEILFTELQEKTPTDCEITVFVGYDKCDKIYSQMEQRMSCNAVFDNFKIEWVEFTDEYKGKPTHIWNELAEFAILKGFEYIKVLGDDIRLPNDKAWLSAMINKLKKNDNIGWSAGWSNNNSIATQFLVHKTHYEIFGFIYPPEIWNWMCDDWLFHIYPDKYSLWLKQYHLLNVGGEPRYEVKYNPNFLQAIIKRYKPKFNRFISLEK